VLGILLAACASVWAQEPEVIHLPQQPESSPPVATPNESSGHVPVNVQEALSELWFRRKAYLEKGQLSLADGQVQLMRDLVRREGILSAEDLSAAFLLDGKRSLEAGNKSRALQSFQLAKDFAPDRPGPYFAVAHTLWSRERDFSGSLSAFLDGCRLTLKNPAARAPAVGNILAVFGAGTLLASCLWCLLSAMRTARLVQHDLYESRKRFLSNNAAQAVAWVLWALPALVWMTGPWILVYWLALAFVYMNGLERSLSVLTCLCFMGALPLLGWITQTNRLANDPSVRFLLRSSRGLADPDRIPALEQMAASNPGVSVYAFLLAQSYHANGSVEAALQEYRQLQMDDPGNAAAWINTGNIFFEKAQYSQAAEEYRQALKIDPKSTLAYYDLSLALQGALRLEEADAAFQKARSLDNALVTSILSTGGEGGRKEPVEAKYSSEEILAHLGKTGGKGQLSDWQRAWLNPLSLAGTLGLLGCVILAGGSERWGLGRAQRCLKCGQPFCRRCQVGMRREEGYCTACRHLFVLKDPTARRVREERERLVARHERWQWISRRLTSLILPGAGQIQGGRSVLGAFMLWMTCVSISGMLLSQRLLAPPRLALFGSPFGTRVLPAILIAACWLGSNMMAFEKKGRG
jgi:tetratricopeptide (TPR) repeat protein